MLDAARGRDNARIVAEMGISVDTARRWRGRFAARRLDGLNDLPRSGRPRRISAAERAAVVALACQLPATTGVPLSRWTGPELATELAARGLPGLISASSILRILAEHPVKPWQYRSWICPRAPDSKLRRTSSSTCTRGFTATSLLRPGDRLLSVDAKPSVWARGRCHPDHPGCPRQARAGRARIRPPRRACPAGQARRAHRDGVRLRPATTGIKPFMDLIGQVMSRPEYNNAPRVFVIADNGSGHRGQAAIDRMAKAHPNAIMIHTRDTRPGCTRYSSPSSRNRSSHRMTSPAWIRPGRAVPCSAGLR